MTDVLKQGRWGVCSFVSVLNAMHQSGKLEEFGKTMAFDDVQKRLGAEIVTYLKMRRIEKPSITDGILTFTQSFGAPYSGYKDIGDLIGRIEQILRGRFPDTDQAITQGGIGVAMTAEAVADYLDFVGLTYEVKTLPAMSFTQSELSKHRDCIIGIGYDGTLKHWIYVNAGGELCNWGSASALNDTASKPKDLGKFTHIYHVIQLK